MFAINGDKVQVEFSDSFSLGIEEGDLEVRSILFCLKSDGIAIISQLHNFCQISNVHT